MVSNPVAYKGQKKFSLELALQIRLDWPLKVHILCACSEVQAQAIWTAYDRYSYIRLVPSRCRPEHS